MADWLLSPDVQGVPQTPSHARAWVLIAHPNMPSRRHAGHAFMADVLRANGFATRSFCLHTQAEQAAGVAPPGLVLSKHRVAALVGSLARQPGMSQPPLVLIGVGDAASGCVAASARLHLPALKSLVFLDARTTQLAHHLVRLALPTLFVLGRCDARRQAQHRTATREMSAPHRTEVLKLPTRPQPVCGALEAFACLTLAWLDATLPREVPGASGSTSDNGDTPVRSTDTGAAAVRGAAHAMCPRGDPAHAPGSGRDRY